MQCMFSNFMSYLSGWPQWRGNLQNSACSMTATRSASDPLLHETPSASPYPSRLLSHPDPRVSTQPSKRVAKTRATFFTQTRWMVLFKTREWLKWKTVIMVGLVLIFHTVFTHFCSNKSLKIVSSSSFTGQEGGFYHSVGILNQYSFFGWNSHPLLKTSTRAKSAQIYC